VHTAPTQHHQPQVARVERRKAGRPWSAKSGDSSPPAAASPPMLKAVGGGNRSDSQWEEF
jgi:hypothetical protein